MRKTFVLAMICCLCMASLAGAQGTDFSFRGVRLNGALLGGVSVPTGADVAFLFPTPGQELFFALKAGAGFEDRMVLRDADTDEPRAAPESFDSGYWFYWPNAQVDVGLVYRPFDLNETAAGIRVELFASMRSRYEANLNSLGVSVFPDMNGLFGNSVIAGAAVDSVRTDVRRMKSGFSGEASVEWGPGFADFVAGTDFFRTSARARGFLPLFSMGADDMRSLSVYAAGFIAADWATGTNIPLYVLTSFGGRDLRSGLGDSVRGYRSWGYETALKSTASAELRAVGPALFDVPGLRPMAYLFADGGYYAGLDRASGTYAAGQAWADADGFLFSAGGGAALGVLDFAYLGLRALWRIPVSDPLYEKYFGASASPFSWEISFLLHF
ncbi:MAG: hypothetical protein WAZ99_03780 [Rectinemataceae bacterium]